jgi:acetyltransferase-like isoleucine patch superfamily enzyme
MNEISDEATISSLVDIEESLRGNKVIIQSGAMLDSFVKIKFAGGAGDVVIGKNTSINSGCVIYSGNGVSIGDGVAIAANCTLAPVNHEVSDRSVPFRAQGFSVSRGGIIIEDDVWIGAGCVLLDGSILRRGCVVGAMSLVKGELPEFSIFGGNPLREIGCRK